MERVMFTKHLKRDGELSLGEAAEQLAALGFDGADLTVRPGGYVEPADARSAIPAAIDIFRDQGLTVPMLTTAITEVDDEARAIFEIADAQDIPHLKLGYWLYDDLGTLDDGLAAMRADLREIADLSTEHDVVPAVHVHSGMYLSAEAGILASVLAEFDPDEIGAYIDPGHMALEGALGGWRMGLDLLADQTVMMAIKDFSWQRTDDGWDKKKVQLREGMVDWPDVVAFLSDIGFDGPVSFHSEYGHIPFAELLEWTRGDLAYIDGILAA